MSSFSWCVSTVRIVKSPIRNIKKLSRDSGKKTDRRAFTEEELTRLFEAVRNRCGRGKDYRREREMIYLTMLGTGLRSGELGSIKISQVTETYIIFETPSEKNRKGTYQPITDHLSNRLYVCANKSPNDFLFHFSKRTLHGVFERDCEAAGIKWVDDRGHVLVPYSFRHTFGTRLARAGVPLTTRHKSSCDIAPRN